MFSRAPCGYKADCIHCQQSVVCFSVTGVKNTVLRMHAVQQREVTVDLWLHGRCHTYKYMVFSIYISKFYWTANGLCFTHGWAQIMFVLFASFGCRREESITNLLSKYLGFQQSCDCMDVLYQLPLRVCLSETQSFKKTWFYIFAKPKP